jgi:hypothetical protein
LIDETNKEASLIGITIPLTYNLRAAVTKNQRKYQELAFEIQQQWQLNKTIVITLVVSTIGVIRLLFQVQKMVIKINYLGSSPSGPDASRTYNRPFVRHNLTLG